MTYLLACLRLAISDGNGNMIQLKSLQSAVNFLCFTPSDLTLTELESVLHILLKKRQYYVNVAGLGFDSETCFSDELHDTVNMF